MDLSNKSILLVEDNKTAQHLCKAYLKKMGVDGFDLAENGQQAVEMTKQRLYDLIIMDIHMPIMDGNQATKQIRILNNGDYPKIIAYTAYDNNTEIGELFDGKITKPTNIINFSKIISDVLNKKELV